MHWLVALFIGILIGWLIEWVIDWLYWRRRGTGNAEKCQEDLRAANEKISALKKQLVDSGVVKKDSLQKIHGIGPVIEGKLNGAGVYTFEDLSELTAGRLEEIVGDEIRNLADEASFIDQARDFARDKS